LNTNARINDNKFHHMLVVRTGKTITWYVDGKRDSTLITTEIYDLYNNADLIAGKGSCDYVDGTVPFTGKLDEIEILYGAKAVIPLTTALDLSHWSADMNANDSFGRYNGTVENVTFGAGVKKQAFEFNGDSDVDFGPVVGNFGTNDFFLSFWIQMSRYDSESIIAKRAVCDGTDFWNIRS